jgi:hypothetical protein
MSHMETDKAVADTGQGDGAGDAGDGADVGRSGDVIGATDGVAQNEAKDAREAKV